MNRPPIGGRFFVEELWGHKNSAAATKLLRFKSLTF